MKHLKTFESKTEKYIVYMIPDNEDVILVSVETDRKINPGNAHFEDFDDVYKEEDEFLEDDTSEYKIKKYNKKDAKLVTHNFNKKYNNIYVFNMLLESEFYAMIKSFKYNL
jgi:hypothetical protein